MILLDAVKDNAVIVGFSIKFTPCNCVILGDYFVQAVKVLVFVPPKLRCCIIFPIPLSAGQDKRL